MLNGEEVVPPTFSVLGIHLLSSQGSVRAEAVRTTFESEVRFLGKRVVCNSSVVF